MIYCELCGVEIDSESSAELHLDGGGRVCTYCRDYPNGETAAAYAEASDLRLSTSEGRGKLVIMCVGNGSESFAKRMIEATRGSGSFNDHYSARGGE